MDDILGKVRGSERESDHVDENDHHHHDADGHVVPVSPVVVLSFVGVPGDEEEEGSHHLKEDGHGEEDDKEDPVVALQLQGVPQLVSVRREKGDAHQALSVGNVVGYFL